ncbi:outer membrane beta-barrel protein [Fibrisoma montanum]|nr:outer membrane beta-barrel protein [Fibrisoma montanum]
MQSQAATLGDSLVIRFANRTRMVIYAPDKAGIKALSAYDLNKIVRDMGMQLDTLPDGKTAVSVNEVEGEKYLKDTVLVITKRKGDVNVVIKGGRPNADSTDSEDDDYRRTQLRYRNRRSGFNVQTDVNIGLNTLLTESQLPAYPADQYSLLPLGSRYISFNIGQHPTIVRGKVAKLSVYYGFELAWNNYMFEEDVVARRGLNGVEFVPIAEPIKKTKLTVCSINLPVVPRVTFYTGSNRKAFHLGVGGFVGYRLDSYTKIKFASSEKERDHSNFYLNDLRYGLIGHLGILRANLFVKYDLNPVFMDGRGPDVRALSFGITL